MAGETELGGFYWKLGVKVTVKEDLDAAKTSVTDFDSTTTEATGSVDLLENANRKNAAGLRAVGSVAMMAGAGVMSLGFAAQSAGGDVAKLAPILIGAGGAMTALGSVSAVAGPLIKAVGWAYTTAIPGIMSFVAAQWAANAALTALAGATVIGAAIVGLWLLYNAMNAAKNNTVELEKAIKELNQTTDEMKYIQTAADEKLKGLKDTLDKSGDSVKGLQQDYDDLNTAMGKQLDIADKLRHADLNIADATQSKRDAQREYSEAVRSGDADDIRRAKNRKNNADEAYNDALRSKTAIQDEDKAQKDTIKTIEEKNKIRSPQELLDKISGVIDNQAKAQEKYNAQLLITEGIEARIKKNDFYAKLLDWQKSGVVLTEEDKSAYSAGPDWMKTAYADYSKKYASTTARPNYLGNVFGPGLVNLQNIWGTATGEDPDTMRQRMYDQDAGTRWTDTNVVNPNAMQGGTQAPTFSIVINGTVTDKKYVLTLNNDNKLTLAGMKS